MRRLLLACIALLTIGGIGWWSFGWESYDNPALGVVEVYRFFGRDTKITRDANRDGRADSVTTFSWSEPYSGGGGECGAPFEAMLEDRNLDGAWDTWTTYIPRTGEKPCSLEVAGDTDADGTADWFRSAYRSREVQQAYDDLKATRGY